MKKIEFKFKNLELVKGCPTDINHNGHEDDDFNNDGSIDQDDQDYYDGYIDGYYDSDNGGGTGDDDGSTAYQSGFEDGVNDHDGDNETYIDINGEFHSNDPGPSSQGDGPDVSHENFHTDVIPLPDGSEIPRY